MKKIINLCITAIIIITVSGCDINKDSMEDINIITTNYATEYITDRLYKDHGNISSIYPNATVISKYNLTKKQLKDYSSNDLYIFNGLEEKEKKYATKMRKSNDKLKIIDTTLTMEYNNGIEELWLDPSNFLMMAQNIKKGFKEYIDNYYLNNDIDKNYEELKIDASNLDAKMKTTVEKANNKTIIATSKMFKYLEKYGLTVYVLDKGVASNDYDKVKTLLNNGSVKYVFVKDTDNTDEINNIIGNANIQTWYTLSTLTEEKKKENADYFSIMNENIDALKNELYK